MINEIKTICVFCGSSAGNDPLYAEAAKKLARILVGHEIKLVYGGALVGIMGILANEFLHHGGQVIGVIPKFLEEFELSHRGLTELHLVETMHERKQKMEDLAEAFVLLPGGFGSMEEFFEVWTWTQLGLHRKPIGILNTKGYFDDLLKFSDHMVNEGFVRQAHRDWVTVKNDPDELVNALLTRELHWVPKWVKKAS